jgi:hypothetical protein
VKVKNSRILFTFLITFSYNLIQAGPPFITDDPDPVPYKHGEMYLGSTGTKSKSEFYAFLPFIEADYGVFKDTQLHIIIPLSIDKKSGKACNYGP